MAEHKQTEHLQENNSRYSSLPPRNTVHKKTEEKKTNHKFKWNFTQITLVSFLILLVASPLFFYHQYQNDNKKESGSILAQNIEVEEAANNINDNEIIDEDKDEIINNEENSPIKDNSISKSDSVTENPKQTNEVEESQQSSSQSNDKGTIHIVKQGENLFRISLHYYSTGKYVDALAKYNQLNNPNDIYAGLSLKIPDKDELLIQ